MKRKVKFGIAIGFIAVFAVVIIVLWCGRRSIEKVARTASVPAAGVQQLGQDLEVARGAVLAEDKNCTLSPDQDAGGNDLKCELLHLRDLVENYRAKTHQQPSSIQQLEQIGTPNIGKAEMQRLESICAIYFGSRGGGYAISCGTSHSNTSEHQKIMNAVDAGDMQGFARIGSHNILYVSDKGSPESIK